MAYAAVISTKHTIHGLKYPINPKIKNTANEELRLLRSMLLKMDDRSSRSIDRSVFIELDAKIRDAVWKVEDVLESYSPSQGIDQLRGVEQEIDSFLTTVKMLREEYNRELLQKPLPAKEEDASAPPLIQNSTTVGSVMDLSVPIIDYLLGGWETEIKTVSLIGMAGIGKSHFATQIFHHPLIVKHFNTRLWVSVGPKDQSKNICLDLVAQIEGKPREVFKGKTERELRGLLQNGLRIGRYLIVLDDIWSTQVLDYFKELLPDYGKKSRFLLTTRLEEVAWYYPNVDTHHIPFLNSEESWNLLWRNVFVDEDSFPFELEKAGRKIAEICEGLPLLILTVANILRGLDKTQEFWEKVAEKKTSTFTDAYEQIYEVLLSSYEYLPQHLKALFLYMGVFPQNCEIPLSKLILLWAIEEFLEPSWQQEVEEFGLNCMKGLVSKSLAIVCKKNFTNFMKSCKLHSAYWHLCVKEARKIRLFYVLNKLTDVSIESPRRFSVQNNILLGIKEVHDSMVAAASTTRSLLCTGEDHQYPVPICFNTMLLKVLDALSVRFYDFPEEVLKLLQLRYLTLTHNGELPCSINKLQLLQWLILRRHHNIKLLNRDPSCLPEEIWDIRELRHLRIMGSNLPNPSKGAMLPKLITLYMNANSCTDYVVRSIPNLRKLRITIELQPDRDETFICLDSTCGFKKLESLKCVVLNPFMVSAHYRYAIYRSGFPWSLKKLSLSGLGCPWIYMRTYVSNDLYVLKLRCSAFQGPIWETENYFYRLHFLLLEDLDLVHWTTTARKFPFLRHLIVRHCYKLKKIPLEFGKISSLERLEIDNCSPSVVDSGLKIKEKRKSSEFQLVINSSWE